MSCVCGTHWCYECGTKCANADETYTHMRQTHGRIYLNDAPFYDDDDE